MLTRDVALALDQFPGALRSETLLSQAWVREHGAAYLGFDFNLRIGEGRDPGDEIAAPLRAAATEQSRRIIDVVAYRANSVDLLEVKGRADPAAIGQLVTYQVLWNRFREDLPVRKLGLIAAIIDATMLSVFNRADISVFIYPELVDAIRRT